MPWHRPESGPVGTKSPSLRLSREKLSLQFPDRSGWGGQLRPHWVWLVLPTPLRVSTVSYHMGSLLLPTPGPSVTQAGPVPLPTAPPAHPKGFVPQSPHPSPSADAHYTGWVAGGSSAPTGLPNVGCTSRATARHISKCEKTKLAPPQAFVEISPADMCPQHLSSALEQVGSVVLG